MFADKILLAMDKGQLTGAIFIDLTKAFDMVNHSILLSKLCSLGVRMPLLLTTGLSLTCPNRCQVTVCNGIKSSPETVSNLVYPKAPFWVPYLFTLYINDLPDYLEHCDVTLYADDTVLFISDKSLHNIKSHMNSGLGKTEQLAEVKSLDALA